MTVHDFDTTTRPQDDLFGHVNGAWIKTAEIPEDRSVFGSFDILRDRSEEHVREIIESAASSGTDGLSRKIGDLYASFMAEDEVEAAGALPLKTHLEAIASVTSTDELVTLLGDLYRKGVAGPLVPYVTIDRGNPTRYLLHLQQSGLGLPDQSYYSLDEHAGVRARYQELMAELLDLAGAGGAAEAYHLETLLAAAHWDRTALRDTVKTYNLQTAQELTEALPEAALFFTAAGLTPGQWSEIVVGQPDVVEAVARLLGEVELDTWKAYCTWRLVLAHAPYLSSAFTSAHFAFFGTVLSGATVMRERWKRGVSFVEAVMGEAVGELYVAQHYPAEAELAMQTLVANLIAAYGERIAELDWMADDTRQRALAKLAAFTPKIGKPARWRDYTDLQITADDLIANLHAAEAFGVAWQLDKLGGPIDRDEWHMTPQTVNAYYNPPMNEIVFPAAILQPPFFDTAIDPAYNYGAIGAVIGHEIGHGFDDQGSRYDGDGTLRDWWTDADRSRFDVKVKALIEQYNGFSPRSLEDSFTVNGSLTVGENIGDLGGVAVAHHAYRLSLAGAEAPVIDGLTGDQRFFIGWALAWRVVARQQEAERRLVIDPHSPPEFRVNVVRNIDAFHEAFGTSPGDGLWLEPAERVAIW